MIYYNFKDYNEFKEIFGMTKHGNGVKSRKNKILLSYLKSREILHRAVTTGNSRMLKLNNMQELKQYVINQIEGDYQDKKYCVRLINRTFHSNIYETDQYKGIAEDGDVKAVRYIKHEESRDKVYKMKAGKFFRAIVTESAFSQLLPEQVIIWLTEEFVSDWQVYSASFLPKNKLYIDKDFSRIYDSSYCPGDFQSCMVDKNLDIFYKKYVDASAAYLQDEEGLIIARAVIFNKVIDEETGKTYRYCERQYAKGGSEILKRTLVDALIKGNHIDIYKQVGAGCSDETAIVDVNGNSMAAKDFYIECDAQSGDALSYQDTFKWLDTDEEKAYNHEPDGYDWYPLDITYGTVGGSEDDEDDNDEYDSYHDTYCYETVRVYVDGSEETCDVDDLEDFVWFDDKWYHKDDVDVCPECGDKYLVEDSYYSEITEKDYCCEDCKNKAEQEYKKENWYWSEYDEEYYENEDDVVRYQKNNYTTNQYDETTISLESYEDLLDNDQLYWRGNTAYDKIDDDTSLPFGFELKQVETLMKEAV